MISIFLIIFYSPLESYEINEIEMEKIYSENSLGRRNGVSSSSIEDIDIPDVYKTIEEEKHIQEILKSVPLLSNFDNEILDILSKVMEEKVVDSGDIVIEQGTPCDNFFIILQGSCAKIIDKEKKEIYGPNDKFGEMFLFNYALSPFTIISRDKLSVYYNVIYQAWTLNRIVFQNVIYNYIKKQDNRYIEYLNKFDNIVELTEPQKLRLIDSFIIVYNNIKNRKM